MATGNELTCRELVELVTDYLEDALPAAERARFDRHLEGCPGCRAHLAQMGTTLALLGRMTEQDVEPGVTEALLTAFREWKQK